MSKSFMVFITALVLVGQIANFSVANMSITARPPIDPPIGAIVAWHKSFSNTPALPNGWVQCDGQTLSDAQSPYNGQVIPNLNAGNTTGGSFIRGTNGTSGTFQNGTVFQQGGSDQVRGVSGVLYNDTDTNDSSSIANRFVGGTLNNQTVAGQGAVTRPVNYSMYWIMRVK